VAVKTSRSLCELKPRIRVVCGKNIALGPGKVELLALVGETGSIGEAAKRMEMSYMRAWTLIQTMNECFKSPLVVTVRGGQKGGGAKLTESGRRALELYRQIEEESVRASETIWKNLQRLLKS